MDQNDIKKIVETLLTYKMETIDYYFQDDKLSQERLELHEKIVGGILNKKTYSKSNAVFILGGAPANGKSSFLKSSYCPYPDTALKIDPDEIKEKLPEYNFMVDNDEPLAAVLVHEESSIISKKLQKRAMEKGMDLILDGIANSTIEIRKEAFDRLKDHKYYIRMDYVSLDSSLSLKIARKRAEETGREVPESFVKAMNSAISKLVPAIIENQYFDEFYLWDTNDILTPILILQKKNGKLVVNSRELYKKFKNKGHE